MSCTKEASPWETRLTLCSPRGPGSWGWLQVGCRVCPNTAHLNQEPLKVPDLLLLYLPALKQSRGREERDRKGAAANQNERALCQERCTNQEACQR